MMYEHMFFVCHLFLGHSKHLNQCHSEVKSCINKTRQTGLEQKTYPGTQSGSLLSELESLELLLAESDELLLSLFPAAPSSGEQEVNTQV